ncbi:MAG: addiction module protein [Bacteroidota bacterium]
MSGSSSVVRPAAESASASSAKAFSTSWDCANRRVWDRIAADQDQVPLQEWHRQILEERLAAHRAAPQDARPWGEVLDGLERRLKTR